MGLQRVRHVSETFTFRGRHVLGVSKVQQEDQCGDFSGSLVVKNYPSNAGELGSNPSGGTKIHHATGQLSLDTISTELACSRAHVPQLECPTEPAAIAGVCVPQQKSLHDVTKILHAATKTQGSQINKY